MLRSRRTEAHGPAKRHYYFFFFRKAKPELCNKHKHSTHSSSSAAVNPTYFVNCDYWNAGLQTGTMHLDWRRGQTFLSLIERPDRFCDIANLLGVKQPRREAHLHPVLQFMNTGNYTSNPPNAFTSCFNSMTPKISRVMGEHAARISEMRQRIWNFTNRKKIKERDNLEYIVLDGTSVVSPLQWCVPVRMATDFSKDNAASIFAPTAPKTGQRWRSELL